MEQAAAAYRKALVIDPDLVPAIVNLANIHYARDELIEAQALYERAIGLDPHCFEAHFNLGNIHHDLGRYEDALVCYRDAVALNPGYPDAHFYLAVTLEKTGQSPEAKPHWRRTRSSRRKASGLSWPASFRSRSETAAQSCIRGERPAAASLRAGQSGRRVERRVEAAVVKRAVNTVRSARASSACGGACRTRTPGTTSPP